MVPSRRRLFAFWPPPFRRRSFALAAAGVGVCVWGGMGKWGHAWENGYMEILKFWLSNMGWALMSLCYVFMLCLYVTSYLI